MFSNISWCLQRDCSMENRLLYFTSGYPPFVLFQTLHIIKFFHRLFLMLFWLVTSLWWSTVDIHGDHFTGCDHKSDTNTNTTDASSGNFLSWTKDKKTHFICGICICILKRCCGGLSVNCTEKQESKPGISHCVMETILIQILIKKCWIGCY